MTDADIRLLLNDSLRALIGPGEDFEIGECIPGIWKLRAIDEVHGTETSRMVSGDALALSYVPREIADFESAALLRTLREGIAN